MPACELPLLDFVNPQFHPGRNTSVRRGERWHGVSRAQLQRHPDGPAITVALSTRLLRFDTLTCADLRDEHDPRCRTPDGLLQVLRRIYPGFDAGERVTLVHFVLD